MSVKDVDCTVCVSFIISFADKETGVTDFIPRKASSRLSLVPNNALCLYISCWSQTCSMVYIFEGSRYLLFSLR